LVGGVLDLVAVDFAGDVEGRHGGKPGRLFERSRALQEEVFAFAKRPTGRHVSCSRPTAIPERPSAASPMSILQIVLAVILPPVGVALSKGFGRDFVVNILLTLLFWLPGVAHALWIVFKK
jgi:uncharacterized membrane protein YqaE (UPF0057 family)